MIGNVRASTLLGLAALTLALLNNQGCDQPEPSAPRPRRSEHPELDGSRIEGLFAAIEAGRYGELHSLIILIDGEPIVEAYFNGHRRDERAPLYSVTKSVLSALIGIAIDEGYIASVDERVLGYFPEYQPVSNLDRRKRRMTVGHLLAMSAGLRWDELSLPYDDPENDYQRYLGSDDRIEYALGLPMDHPPGVKLAYNTSLSQILSAILSRATGRSAAEYAEEKLFGPLGIDDWYWAEYDSETSVGGAGLYLLPMDMAKIGQLYLQEGRWEGRQVVPAEWVEATTTSHGQADRWRDYGYHWWLYNDNAARSHLNGHDDIFFAVGRGGQYIWVLPWARAVVACTAWNDANGYWPEPLLWDFVGPAIRR